MDPNYMAARREHDPRELDYDPNDYLSSVIGLTFIGMLANIGCCEPCMGKVEASLASYLPEGYVRPTSD